jgi:hypothetical protein
MCLRLYQRQNFGLGSPKRVVQFLDIGQSEAVERTAQLDL